MADNRRKYTKEFKGEAIWLLNTNCKSGYLLEQELGTDSGMVYRRRREAGQDGERAPPGNGIPRDEELSRLRKDNAELRKERDIGEHQASHSVEQKASLLGVSRSGYYVWARRPDSARSSQERLLAESTRAI